MSYFDQHEVDIRFEWNLPGLEALAPISDVVIIRNARAVAASLQGCGSGQELIGRGLPEDVQLGGQLNVSNAAPLLTDGAYQ